MKKATKLHIISLKLMIAIVILSVVLKNNVWIYTIIVQAHISLLYFAIVGFYQPKK